MRAVRVDDDEDQTEGAPRVLVVEDQEMDALLVRRALRRALPSATSVRAHDVREAVHLLRKGQTDVALVDWCLPDGLGSEVAERAAEQRPEVPVVLMSKGTPDTHVDSVSGFISKGELTPARLRAVLRRALSRRPPAAGGPPGDEPTE